MTESLATVSAMTTDRAVDDQERADFLETLASHRGFLRHTVRDLTDEQAREPTTVSELCLGGLVKHVSRVESRWCDFIVRGPDAIGSGGDDAMEAHAAGFRMDRDETLAVLLERYEEVARHTDRAHRVPGVPGRFSAAACGTLVRARGQLVRASGPSPHCR
jgi:hypothetical protein